MDPNTIIEALQGTMDPTLEHQLSETHKSLNFVSPLLQITVGTTGFTCETGRVYISPYTIPEEDCHSIIHSPELIRVQVTTCIHHIIKHDYPSCWTAVVDKIGFYLQYGNSACWLGILLCLYHPLVAAMQHFLPVLKDHFIQLLSDQSDQSVIIQKQIFKIFYALIQHIVPLELTNQQKLTEWIEILRTETLRIEEDDRPELFERCGSPGNYSELAEVFLKAFVVGVQQVLLKEKQYIIPQVLQLTLNSINQGVSHALTWKNLKRHIQGIIQDVIFPLMCYTDADEELWEEEPYEYIRMKFDVFEDFISFTTAAQKLLFTARSKRKQVLQKTVGFYGALHMIGSELGYMRARACWFCEVKFKSDQNLQTALELTRRCLIDDRDMPVEVEAAIVFQVLISNQEKFKEYITPFIRSVMQALLHIIRETENDDLTNLAMTFSQVIQMGPDKEGSDDKAVTAVGILNTADTLLNHKEITQQLEGICLQVIGTVLQQHVSESYEEIFSLVCSLTCQQVSPQMWQLLPLVFEVFQQDGFDYFTDMMPLLCNYVTVLSKTLLSDTKYLEMIYSMCKKVLTGVAGEDAECQCKGRDIDQFAIATLHYNAYLLLNTLENLHFPNNVEPVTNNFIRQWLNDVDCFLRLHDRNMCGLSLCALIDMEQTPQGLNQVSGQILPAFILLFNGLKRAYACHALLSKNDSDDDEAEDDDETEELGSDEDDIDKDGKEYLEILTKQAGEDGDDENWEEDDAEETAREGYSTVTDDEDNPVVEYQIFKAIFQTIQNHNPVWYQSLTHVTDVATLADQRRADHESKMIETHRGYKFSAPVVPDSFNFGGPAPGMN
uniref:Importin N-terminal domain-containing protein n=1 Tax=Colobus angolensis palliatus TaxID=336983 RepID=A0A2K5HQL9_COLAP